MAMSCKKTGCAGGVAIGAWQSLENQAFARYDSLLPLQRQPTRLYLLMKPVVALFCY
jgi:hypothetical protein